MTTGFRKSDGDWQEKCPCCGRFPHPDDGYYMFVAEDPDFISLFCDDVCARRYQMKGGRFVDGDGLPYIPKWKAAQ